MTEPTPDSAAACAIALLIHYGFEMGGYKAEELVANWLNDYQANWVRLAVIEALYQGRYKSVSVEQILASWNRRSRATYHFNHEFERLICRKFPQNLADGLTSQAAPRLPQESESSEMPDCEQVVHHRHSNKSICADPPTASENTEALSPQPLEKVHDSSVSLVIPVSVFNTNNVPTEPRVEAEELKAAKEWFSDTERVHYEADWSRWEAAKRPINQFTPPPESF